MAVQVAPGRAPVTVKTAGVDSDAFSGVAVTVPEVQVSLTGTVATLFGMKSLWTTTVSLLSVLAIMQTLPSATFRQFAWFAV